MGILNINVGILGHVDSGKTSLVKALSSILSTAALDKHPQSQQRGITLDLGFSAFTVEVPDHLPKDKYSHLQFTLVDCPGHASLIRTVIGGAQIMDMMVLVVDVTKGLQTQTVECIVIGETAIASGADALVVLNKIDLIPEDQRAEKLEQARKDIVSYLAGTKLSNASIVHCTAAIGGQQKIPGAVASVEQEMSGEDQKGVRSCDPGAVARDGSLDPAMPEGRLENVATFSIANVVSELTRMARVPNRNTSAPFYFAFDHCFSVRGVGTILTGTVLTGEVKVNQSVELPALRLQKRVKSMQVFRKPVTAARAGDRLALCLGNLEAKSLERGVVAAPGSVKPAVAAIALVREVKAFRGHCRSGAYCHISLGHTTVMATTTFFGSEELKHRWRALLGNITSEDFSRDKHNFVDLLTLDEIASLPFPWEAEFVQQQELLTQLPSHSQGLIDHIAENSHSQASPTQYCLLSFHVPVITPPSSIVLGSRLDRTGLEDHTTKNRDSRTLGSLGGGEGSNRIAFHGRLVADAIDHGKSTAQEGGACARFGLGIGTCQLKLFNEKVKQGVVFRVGAADNGIHRAGTTIEVFGKDLFKKETNMSPFIGMLVHTQVGAAGKIESAFGKAGRFKARFPRGTHIKVGDKLLLRFRKYARDSSNTMHQTYLQSTPKKQEGLNGEEFDNSPGYSVPSTERRGTLLREGCIESIRDIGLGSNAEYIVVVSGLFSQEEDIRAFARIGMTVQTSTGVQGILRGPFGKLGKCKVTFPGATAVQVGDRVFVLQKW